MIDVQLPHQNADNKNMRSSFGWLAQAIHSFSMRKHGFRGFQWFITMRQWKISRPLLPNPETRAGAHKPSKLFVSNPALCTFMCPKPGCNVKIIRSWYIVFLNMKTIYSRLWYPMFENALEALITSSSGLLNSQCLKIFATNSSGI